MISQCNDCGKTCELYDEQGTIKNPKYCLICFAAMTGFYFNHEKQIFEEDEHEYNKNITNDLLSDIFEEN